MFGTRSILNLTAVATVFVLVASLSSSALAQNLLLNGDFEDTEGWGLPGTDDAPKHWTPDTSQGRKNPALQQSGTDAIGGSGTSAFMPAFPADKPPADPPRRDMWNVRGGTWPQWTLEFDFASQDPGGDGDRSLSGAVEVTGNNRITMRVTDVDDNGFGDFQFYNGAWQPVPELANAVEFDTDVTTTPVVNHITFTGRFNEPSPVYDVTITNGLMGSPFTATDLSYFRYARLPSGAEGIDFNTFISAEGAGHYLLDNVVLTHVEPVRPDQYIVNGDFEETFGWGDPGTTDFPPGWSARELRKNAAAQASLSAAIGGSGTSAYMEPFITEDEEAKREIRQSFAAPTTNDWQLDLDLAAAPTTFVEERSFAFELEGFDGGKLFVRVVDHDETGVGDLQFFDGDWQSVAELDNSIVPDSDLSSDLLANHLTIVGHYADETPSYDVFITDASSIEFSATGLTLWADSAPGGGLGGVGGVSFNTFNSAAAYVIDNVSMIDVEGALIPGDTDGDNDVDADDLAVVAAHWGAAADPNDYAFGNFNDDTVVDAADAAIQAAHWTGSSGGESATVPEPSTLVLLGIGVIVLLPLRRRW